tara:strand:+ start:163 stop:882 length:720 start_codon:yes stop_codon:yes gene_type:complete
MAALDYGMALSRGLVAPQKVLQDEVRKLAGDQFKSEDWWNKQLDRQIKEGYVATRDVTDKITTTTTKYNPNPDYKPREKNPKYNPLNLTDPTLAPSSPTNITSYRAELRRRGGAHSLSRQGVYGRGGLIQQQRSANEPEYLYGDMPEYFEDTTSKVTYNTRQVTGKGPLTDAELKAIQGQAEEKTRQAKRKTADLEKGTRQKRGATGLMGRSEIKKAGLSPELPQLGFDGLGIQKTFLG